MKCARCQHENRPTARFCSECERPVVGGSPVAPRFGSPDAHTPRRLAEKILTSRHAMEGERRLHNVNVP